MTSALAVSLIACATLPAQQAARWTVKEQIRIGAVDGSAQALTRVGDVLLGEDGQIYIAQPDDQTIRVFSHDGQLIRTIGRAGKGPGEFERLFTVGFLGDTLYATDQGLRRVSLFTPTGDLIRTYDLATPLISSAPRYAYSPTVPKVLLSDGTALVSPSISVAWLAAGKDRIPMWRFHIDRFSLDTIAQAEYEVPNAIITHQGRRLGVPKPFPDAPMHSFLADGTGVLIVHRKTAPGRRTATFRIAKVDLSGDTVFQREIQYDPVRLPESLIAEAVADIHERLSRRPPAPSEREILAGLREGGHLPEVLPPVADAASGLDGTIWIKREQGPASQTLWQVFNAEGTPIASVELERKQSVKLVSGATLVVTELDDLDVPYVTVYRIQK
jgi:hypothetical protein